MAQPICERLRDTAQQMRGLLRIQHQARSGHEFQAALFIVWCGLCVCLVGLLVLRKAIGNHRRRQPLVFARWPAVFCIFAFGWVGFSLEVLTLLLLLLLQLTLAPAVHTPVLEHVLGGAYNLLAFPISYAAVIIPLRRKLGPSLDFARPAHSALFIASALFASALAAMSGSIYLVFMGVIKSGQWMAVFMNWLTGDSQWPTRPMTYYGKPIAKGGFMSAKLPKKFTPLRLPPGAPGWSLCCSPACCSSQRQAHRARPSVAWSWHCTATARRHGGSASAAFPCRTRSAPVQATGERQPISVIAYRPTARSKAITKG